MNKRAIIAIAKKEFFNFINSSAGYVIIVPFLIVSSFLYLRVALVSNEASLRPYFELFPWLLLFLAPAIAMRLFAEERKNATLELLFSHPLKEWEIVVAKFLGGLAILVLVLILTLSLPLTLIIFSRPDLGIIASQYLGAFFSAAAFLALGLLVSVFCQTVISSFLAAAAAGFLLILSGLDMVILMFPSPLDKIISQISLLPHMNSIARGVLDMRDISYFLSLTAIFLIISSIKLAARKIKEDKKGTLKLNFIFWLALIIGIGFNLLFNFYPYRLDLTKSKLFTLSKGTKQTLKKLPDEVKITVYASNNLPGAMQSVFKEVKDLLKDYQRYNDKLKVEFKSPDTNSDVAKEAVKAGIQEVSFNKIGTQKFEVQNGFLGLVVNHKDKSETIPFIQKTSDLEYQLTKKIRKLTADKEKTIGWYSNDYSGQYQNWQKNLRMQYGIKMVDFQDKKVPEDIASLVFIDTGASEEATASAALKDYLDHQGKALVLTKGVSINPRSLTVTDTKSTIKKLLLEYGINLNSDLVYDKELNESVTLGQGNVRYLMPYPFWLKALPTDDNLSVLNNIQSVSLAWPSSLEIDKKKDFSYQRILETGLSAGKQKDKFNLMPNELKSLAPGLKQKILLAVSAEKDGSKLVVVSDYNFSNDQFTTNSRNNLAFAVNLVDWLAADKDLASVPVKTSGRSVFRFSNPIQPIIVQYGNIFLPSILVVGFAFFWLARRKRRTLRTYYKY